MCSRRSFVRSLSPSVVISVPAIPTEPGASACRAPRGCASASTCPSPTGPSPPSPWPARCRPSRRAGRRRRCRLLRIGASRRARRRPRRSGSHIHPTRLLSLSCERETLRHPPPSALANCPRCSHHSASVDTRIEIRRALERGRTATEALLAPVSDDDLAAQVSPARAAARLEPRARRTLRGALDPPHARRTRGRIPDVHDHVYDAFRRERSNGAKLPTLSPKAVRAYAARRARAVARRARARRPRGARRPRQARLRLRARPPERAAVAGVDARDAAVPDRAPSTATSRRRRPTARPAGRTRSTCRAARSPSAPMYEPWAYDNELEPHEVELPRVPHRPRPGDERRVRGVRRGHGLPLAQELERRGLGLARARGRRRAALLGAVELRLGAHPLRPTRADHAVGARAARLVPRGRGVRALGGQAPPHRGRVGASRRAGTTTRASSGTRGARRGWASRRASTAAASPPPPPARTPAASARSAACRWPATSGSGRPPRSSRTPASSRSRTRSAPRSTSATTCASCEAARGRPTRSSRARRSAAGRARSAARLFAGFRCARDA